MSGLLDQLDEHVRFWHIQSGIVQIDFHLHEGCEIYYLLAGDVRYFVEGAIYPLAVGSVIITNHREIHKPTFTSDATYERAFLQFDPQYIRQFNSECCDLLACFYEREKGEQNHIVLTKADSVTLGLLMRRYEQWQKNPQAGAAQMKLAALLEILLFVNERFKSQKNKVMSIAVHKKLTATLNFIEHHLTQDLSLAALERELYINRYYLSKLFKRHVGSTIHEYITYKRIGFAKQLLADGCSVSEACERSGFSDYTSFLKMFKRTVGVLPKDYPTSQRPRSSLFSAE